MNEITNPGESAGARDEGGTIPRHRILVVDDDPDIRHLLAMALGRSGYHVDAAEDGAAGWEALNAGNYDLLVTDNNMPRISGTELIKKVHAARMALPVVLAAATIPGEEAGLQIAAMLQKPFTTDQLVQTVREVLSAPVYPYLPTESPPPNPYRL